MGWEAQEVNLDGEGETKILGKIDAEREDRLCRVEGSKKVASGLHP